MTAETERNEFTQNRKSYLAEVGVLSHGQLALMLGEAANRLGISIVALGPHGKDPSPASYAMRVIDGDYKDPYQVFMFARGVRSLILDTDHVSSEGLARAAGLGVKTFPTAKVNEITQDRIKQKTALNKAGIETAPWAPVRNYEDLRHAINEFGASVIKITKEGYDGNGNRIANSQKEGDEVWREFEGRELIVEKKVNWEMEVATVAAQDVFGGKAVYPVVKSYHKNGMLEYTVYDPKLDPDIAAAAREVAYKTLNVLGVGSHGIEEFVTVDQVTGRVKILVNEEANRPHNTAHWTIEGVWGLDGEPASQFDNLVRIAAGMHVVEPHLKTDKYIIMRNLNGGLSFPKATDEHYKIVESMGGNLHDYHKSPRDNRPNPPRKRMHIYHEADSEAEGVDNTNKMINAIGFKD